MEQWLTDNLISLLGLLISLLGLIIGGSGLWFTGFAIRADAKARQISNLLTITTNHRELWKIFLLSNELERARDTNADISKQPVTIKEAVFVGLVIQQTNSAYYALKDKLVTDYEGLRRDVAAMFSLPIPKAVWRESKPLQNRDFADFIDSCQNEK
jgi:hypothetical protein